MALERGLPLDEAYKKSPHYKIMLERHEFVRQFLENKIVLDTCCGVGFGTHKFSQNAKKVYGVDISSDAIQFAQGHYNTENLFFKVMNVLKLEFPENMFDVVTLLESIEHFSYKDGKEYLEEVRRVLKPDGLLIGTTPLCGDAEHALILQEMNPYHLCMYTEESLKKQLRRFFKEILVLKKLDSECLYFIFIATDDKKKYRELLNDSRVKQLLMDEKKFEDKYFYNKEKYYYSYAASRFVKGDVNEARRYFLKTIGVNILNIRAFIYFYLTFLPSALMGRLRAMKRRYKRIRNNE